MKSFVTPTYLAKFEDNGSCTTFQFRYFDTKCGPHFDLVGKLLTDQVKVLIMSLIKLFCQSNISDKI